MKTIILRNMCDITFVGHGDHTFAIEIAPKFYMSVPKVPNRFHRLIIKMLLNWEYVMVEQ